MTAQRMPIAFFGHGSPMNALEDNRYTRAWRAMGQTFPRPRAILSISAHWVTRGSAVTAQTSPPTIHDFGGFPDRLFAARYPAPGDPELVLRLRELLGPHIQLDNQWGLDHGTWSVLMHVYPKADIPVVQLSLDATLSAGQMFELGQTLKPLRDEGILVLGSGNIVHNLGRMNWQPNAPAYLWAERFDALVVNRLESGDWKDLLDYASLGEDALWAVPTPEHYLPLIYCLGCAAEGDQVVLPTRGITGGAVSMLSVIFGAGALATA